MAIILFFCFRGYIGRDWFQYYLLYKRIPSFLDNKLDMIDYDGFKSYFYYGVEPLYILYQAVTKIFFPNYLVWLNFNTAVDIFILSIVIKYFDIKNKHIFFLLFCVFGGISFELDALRNAKAIYIFLVSLRYSKEKRFFNYLLLNILGCFFHISAVLYILFYFISNKKFNRIVIIFLFVFGYIIQFSKINIFSVILNFLANFDLGRVSGLIKIYSITSGNVASYSGEGFGLAERFFTFAVLFVNERRLYKIFQHRMFINAMYIYLLIFLYCSSIYILAERLPLLFIFSYWFIYPEIYNLIKEKGVFLVLLMTYTTLKFLSAWANPESLYENVLIEHMTVEERVMYVESNSK
jgi:hypothetical protein